MEGRKELQIRRRPLPDSPLMPPPPYTESPTRISAGIYGGYDSSLFDDYAESAQPQAAFPSVDHFPVPSPRHNLRATRSTPNLQRPSEHVPPLPSKRIEAAQKAGQAVVTAFEEARHFAGGLVSHPFESTKHYSILRHASGLVFYSGSHTNIAITVFADRELPPDRSFWLQRKGWSGNTGLKAGALFGAHSAWIDVTPAAAATVDHVKETDERAWQRDISKFLRKASGKIGGHVPRETDVLRVPCEAEDGYLRIVMCSGENGKKTLCPSPVFRLASTSMDGSSMRGASLKTLPIEAAVKIGTTVGTQVVNRFAGTYIQTAQTVATSKIGSVYTATAAKTAAAQRAYSSSGISQKLDSMNEAYDQRRINQPAASLRFNTGPATLSTLDVIGDDSGPTPPYPIRFQGKVTPASTSTGASHTSPTLTLTDVSGEVPRKYPGTHIGYASAKLAPKELAACGLTRDWHRAIISIQPAVGARIAVVQKNIVTVTLLPNPSNSPDVGLDALSNAVLQAPHDPSALHDTLLSVLLMAFVQPPALSASPSHPRPILNSNYQLPETHTTTPVPFRPSPSPLQPRQHLQPHPTTISSTTPTTPTNLPHLAQQTHNSLSRPTYTATTALATLSSRSYTSLSATSSRSLTERYVALRTEVQERVVDRVPAHWVGVRTEGALRRDWGLGRGGFWIRR